MCCRVGQIANSTLYALMTIFFINGKNKEIYMFINFIKKVFRFLTKDPNSKDSNVKVTGVSSKK